VTEQYKRLRRYSDDEIKQLVRETYIKYAWAFSGRDITKEEAAGRWQALPAKQKALLETITVGVYRALWFEKEDAAMQEIVDISQEAGLYEKE